MKRDINFKQIQYRMFRSTTGNLDRPKAYEIPITKTTVKFRKLLQIIAIATISRHWRHCGGIASGYCTETIHTFQSRLKSIGLKREKVQALKLISRVRCNVLRRNSVRFCRSQMAGSLATVLTNGPLRNVEVGWPYVLRFCCEPGDGLSPSLASAFSNKRRTVADSDPTLRV